MPEWDCLRCRCRSNFERITSVEIAQNSYDDLAANAAVPHIQAVHSTTEDYLNAARGRWDFAIVDPPRAGLGERVAKSLAGLSDSARWPMSPAIRRRCRATW